MNHEIPRLWTKLIFKTVNSHRFQLFSHLKLYIYTHTITLRLLLYFLAEQSACLNLALTVLAPLPSNPLSRYEKSKLCITFEF